MGAALGRSRRHLIDELAQDASRYEFFQAVRLLGLAARRPDGEKPRRLRFRTPAALAFPPSELVRFDPAATSGTPDDRARDEMTVAFLGLVGPSGVLPAVYTELLVERRHLRRDGAAHAFLDLFNHRAMSLFYRAWHKYRCWLAVEAGADGATRHVLDLAGFGLDRLRARLGMPDIAGIDEAFLTRHAGLFAQKPLSAHAAASLVEAFAKVPTTFVPFVGQWIELPPGERTRLGGAANVLAHSAVVGGRMRDRQGKVRLRLGPMRRPQFERFLPGTSGAEALRALLRLALGFGLAADITLVLDRRDTPEPRLAQQARLRLGATLWLVADVPPDDLDQVSYQLLR